MIARATGAALLVLGAAIGILPFVTWYSAPPAADPTDASGFVAAVRWMTTRHPTAMARCRSISSCISGPVSHAGGVGGRSGAS